MLNKRYAKDCAGVCLLAAIMLMALKPAAGAQAKQLFAWQDALDSLQNATGGELTQNGKAVAQIRNGIEFWLKFHPASKNALAAAPPQPWGVEEIRSQVSMLRTALDAIIKEDTAQPFNLGVMEVSVTAEVSDLSPAMDSLSGVEIENRQIVNLSSALEVLPGVTIDNPSNQRNESKARIRGFSTTGQVPVYLDGIPVYIPYDGNIDLGRFLTSDLAEVQVEKGYSSPLQGPNGLVGSFNMVTREPVKKFEGSLAMGTGSGDVLANSIRLGSRWEHFYIQGTFDMYQRDFIPLSGNYTLNSYQSNRERLYSDTSDQKWSGRVAWTPKSRDQYTFSYINQSGRKTGLTYIGPVANARRNYWKWPYYDKSSYYFISNTGIGEESAIKFRAYYDQFQNAIDMTDGPSFTMNGPRADHSNYDDHTGGASAEFTTRLVPHHTLSTSIFFKDDTHKSRDYYPNPAPGLLYPVNSYRNQMVSIGLQDVIRVTPRVRLTVGFSADHLKGLHADDYNSSYTAVIPLTCFASPDNTSYSGCMAHGWTLNPQVSASYSLTRADTLFAIFSDRGRFPMMKESYSHRLGSAVPNPDLKAERSRNWDIGYSRSLAGRTLMQIEYFHSSLRDAIQSINVADPLRDSEDPQSRLCPSNTMSGYWCSQNYNVGLQTHQGAEISLRSNPMARVVVDASYSYINRTIAWDLDKMPETINLATLSLPSLPKNKCIGNVAVQLPYQALGMMTYRYEGGIRIQDTNFASSSPNYAPYGEHFSIVDMGAVVPLPAGFKVQAGIKNLLDREYYYAAGYPEAGRNWYFNMRWQF